MPDKGPSQLRRLPIFPYLAGGVLAILCAVATTHNAFHHQATEDVLEALLFLGAGGTYAWLIVTLGLYGESAQKGAAEKQIERLDALNCLWRGKYEAKTKDLHAANRRNAQLTARLLTKEEDEKSRYALAIHDGPTQTASGAHMHLQAWRDRFQHYWIRDREAHRGLEVAVSIQQRVIRELRAQIDDLDPPSLRNEGLPAALKEKVSHLKDEGMSIRFTHEPNDTGTRFPKAVETALYRVALESLSNIRKHADAKNALVHLKDPKPGRNEIELCVEDDGRGFHPDSEYTSTSSGPGERIGLNSMRERVVLLGGELRVSSQPGLGTQVRARIPATEEPE